MSTNVKALARRTDAPSSALAAAEHTASGRRASHCRIARATVVKYPGHSSRELAVLGGLERHEMGRCLADIRNRGLVVSIYSAERKALLWYDPAVAPEADEL